MHNLAALGGPGPFRPWSSTPGPPTGLPPAGFWRPGFAQRTRMPDIIKGGAARLHTTAVQGGDHPFDGAGPPARDAAVSRGRLHRRTRHPVLCRGAGHDLRGLLQIQEGHQKAQPLGHPALRGGRTTPHPGGGGRHHGGCGQRPGGAAADMEGPPARHPHVIHYTGPRVPFCGCHQGGSPRG